MDILYPPRPKSKIPPNQLSFLDKLGSHIAQPKYNGTRNVIHIYPDGRIEMINRHGGPHKQYTLKAELRNQIASLNLEIGKEYWIDSELMHNKTTNLKDTIVLFDILQAGHYLFGVNQLDRLQMLFAICDNPTTNEPEGRALEVFPNLWLAPTIDKDFKKQYDDYVVFEELEGLVLREKKSHLDNYGQKEYTVSWQIRCRKSNKMYNF